MKAIIQRVMQASVTVGEETVGSIGQGLCVLLGISRFDTTKEMESMVRKILNLRIFDDEEGRRWKASVKEKNFDVLCVSQFTLQCILKGNKPDFHEAMGADKSEEFYNLFLEKMKQSYSQDKIKNGKFGAAMQVHIQNDGPVTIEIDYPPTRPEKSKVEEKS